MSKDNIIFDEASAILSKKWQTPVQITQVEKLSEAERRNQLWRCMISSGKEEMPASIVLKQSQIPDHDLTCTHTWQVQGFFCDWAGSAFLSKLPADISLTPQFYGGSLQHCFILLEDLGNTEQSLVQPLLEGTQSEAINALTQWVTCLADLHVHSIGQVDTFNRLLQEISPWAIDAMDSRCNHTPIIQQFLQLVDRFGEVSNTLKAEVGRVHQTINDPGPFLGYVHHDSCPDNVIYYQGNYRLIDFEFGIFGHVLMDLMHVHMMMPTCWCANRIPINVINELSQHYRRLLIPICPEASDDGLWQHHLIEVFAFILMNRLRIHVEQCWQEDQNWGIAMGRARIFNWLDLFINMAEKSKYLPAILLTMKHIRQSLATEWGDIKPLPLYPAFR